MVPSRAVCYGLELVPSPRDSSRLAFRASAGLTDQLLSTAASIAIHLRDARHLLYTISTVHAKRLEIASQSQIARL